MVKAIRGTLVKCDASIKAMLVDIDSKNNNEYIIEELDEEHILVKETRINELKARLNQVRFTNMPRHDGSTLTRITSQMMRERLKEPESSDSE
ncbi:nucleotide-excision repair [Alternaria burnsii]|uniref:General transcription and DNA repair factor IIH subunit TFB5 n=1 Tax=Alternaria burnsii TaxID=1187904 RepID=A0A8H7B8L9_9PLEO|nr:nucleotide-excision repair [Alternaria burnsii]KAF7679776.1 nucleotide-excision repair [Alternaria burnsii]